MPRWMRRFMASEVLFDTSGFFALMDARDTAHSKAKQWLASQRTHLRPVTTEWVIGETCTLLVAGKRSHLVTRFLDSVEQSTALLTLNPDHDLLVRAKEFIRRQAGQGYAFVVCVSSC